MTIFVDLQTGRIIHVIEGRSYEAVSPFLKKLARYAKNLKAVAVDISRSYRLISIAREKNAISKGLGFFFSTTIRI